VLQSRVFRYLAEAEQIATGRSPGALSEEEDYWHQIQRAFDLDLTMINLNNGSISLRGSVVSAPAAEEQGERAVTHAASSGYSPV
jgi:hypothetical protein